MSLLRHIPAALICGVILLCVPPARADRLISFGCETNNILVAFNTAIGNAPTCGTTSPHSGTYRMDTNNAASSSIARAQLAAQKTTGTLFVAMRFTTSTATPGADIIFFADQSNAAANALQATLLTTGKLRLTNAVTATTADTTASLSASTWYEVQLDHVIADSGGSMALRLYDDSCTLLDSVSITGEDTLPTNILLLRVGKGSSVAGVLSYDDLAVNDEAGSFQNGVPACGRNMAFVKPASDDTVAFTKTGANCSGTTNTDCVDDLPGTPDDASGYNAGATNGLTDRFNISTIPTEVPSDAVIRLVHVLGKMGGSSTSGSGTAAWEVWDEGGSSSSGTVTAMCDTASWSTPEQHSLLALNTAGKTKANIQSFDIGYTTVSLGGPQECRATALYMMIEWITAPAAPTKRRTTAIIRQSFDRKIFPPGDRSGRWPDDPMERWTNLPRRMRWPVPAWKLVRIAAGLEEEGLRFMAAFPPQPPAGIEAASCAFADVNSAVGSASAGDTVVIPVCPTQENWSSKLNITKAITLMGSGNAMGAGPRTIIGDDAGANTALIAVSGISSGHVRITNLEIVGVGATHFNGVITLGGVNSTPFRIDHVNWTNPRSKGVVFGSDSCLEGVIDHIRYVGSGKIPVEFHQGGCGGEVNGMGNWGESLDLTSGSLAGWIVVEDSTLRDTAPAVGPGAVDGFDGAKAIVRYCVADSSGIAISDLTNHGTDSSNIRRSHLALIVHDCTFTPPSANHDSGGILRGGTGLFYNITWEDTGTNYYKPNPVKLQLFRATDCWTPYGCASGVGSYDKNDASNPFVSGTATAGSGTDLLEDTTKDFTTACAGGNCGTGDYTFRNVTQDWASTICSSTATTLTICASKGTTTHGIDPGDSYQVNKVYPALDQVGRAGGDLMSGSPPTPAAWPNQPQVPPLAFANIEEHGGGANARSADTLINENRDFVNENTSWTPGTSCPSGVCVGTIAQRAGCTASTENAQVFYWATDERQAYKCTATDTWTLYYKEAPYPYCYQGVGPGCRTVPRGRPAT